MMMFYVESSTESNLTGTVSMLIMNDDEDNSSDELGHNIVCTIECNFKYIRQSSRHSHVQETPKHDILRIQKAHG